MPETPLPTSNLTDPLALRGYAHPLRMRLVGLLRREGPLTATQAAARLAESVPRCSFHLRQLAKYGLIERAAGADSRERPWRATEVSTSWDNHSDDPQVRAATDQLNAVLLAGYLEGAQAWLARRHAESAGWNSAAGFGDSLSYLTADELKSVDARLDAILAEFDHRGTDPALRPPGARPVNLIRLAFPLDRPDGSDA